MVDSDRWNTGRRSSATRQSRSRSILNSARCWSVHGVSRSAGVTTMSSGRSAGSNTTSDRAGCGGRRTRRSTSSTQESAQRDAGTSTRSIGSSTADGVPAAAHVGRSPRPRHGSSPDRRADRPVHGRHGGRRCGSRRPDPARRPPRPRLGDRRLALERRSNGHLGASGARRVPTPAGADRPARGSSGRTRDRTLGIRGGGARGRTRPRRPADRRRRSRTDRRLVHRTATDRRRPTNVDWPPSATTSCSHICPPICAPASICATRPASSRCCAAPASKSTTHGHGGSSSCATSTRSSTRCSSGARPSGWRRPSGTAGSTNTSVPTADCAVRGRRRTARPAG